MSSWTCSSEYHKHQKHEALPYGSAKEIKSRSVVAYAWRPDVKGSDVQMSTLQIERSEASLFDQLESSASQVCEIIRTAGISVEFESYSECRLHSALCSAVNVWLNNMPTFLLSVWTRKEFSRITHLWTDGNVMPSEKNLRVVGSQLNLNYSAGC